MLISADAEWRIVKEYLSGKQINSSPFGEWFSHQDKDNTVSNQPVIYFHGGWGKVSAAASTQYVIDKWNPDLLINLGTCGGFEGETEKGQILLIEKTIIYDIFELMGDPESHIRHYTTDINLFWIQDPLPVSVKRSLIVSGDRDLFIQDISWLKEKYQAIAGDWESGAIAWVANKNHKECLILRGVTDIVGSEHGEAYNGNISIYYENSAKIMKILIESLPDWLSRYLQRLHSARSEK